MADEHRFPVRLLTSRGNLVTQSRRLKVLPSITKPPLAGSRAPRCRLLSVPLRRAVPPFSGQAPRGRARLRYVPFTRSSSRRSFSLHPLADTPHSGRLRQDSLLFPAERGGCEWFRPPPSNCIFLSTTPHRVTRSCVRSGTARTSGTGRAR